MRLLAISLLTAALVLLAGCSSRQERGSATRAQEQSTNSSATTAPAPQDDAARGAAAKTSNIQDGQMKPASLQNAQNSQPNVIVTERKLIRNADITLESGNPAESQRRISMMAEAHGGFVITSESKQMNAEGQLKPESLVTVTIRVPAAQFDAVLNEIQASGVGIAQSKVSSQDVTEEYIDLEARIRAKQALEAQFMEIMKQAKTVSEALEVQTELSDVRAEIERLEGRRRFLENQTSLSTINVTIRPPTQIVSSTGFFYSVKRSFGDGLDVAAMITLGIVQLVVSLLPILLFIVLPAFLIIRYWIRRAQRRVPEVSVRQQQPPPPATAT